MWLYGVLLLYFLVGESLSKLHWCVCTSISCDSLGLKWAVIKAYIPNAGIIFSLYCSVPKFLFIPDIPKSFNAILPISVLASLKECPISFICSISFLESLAPCPVTCINTSLE